MKIEFYKPKKEERKREARVETIQFMFYFLAAIILAFYFAATNQIAMTLLFLFFCGLSLKVIDDYDKELRESIRIKW